MRSSIVFVPFIIVTILFLIVMKRDRRTIMTGILFVLSLVLLFLGLQYVLYKYSKTIDAMLPFAATVSSISKVIMFIIGLVPMIMIMITIWYGITVIRKEGLRSHNARTLGFAIILIVYTVFWPMAGQFRTGYFTMSLYAIISYCVIYLILLKSMYTMTSIINLIHRKDTAGFDYLILMGAGLKGDKSGELMKRRIDKLYELWQKSPKAKVVVTGGWSDDEYIQLASEYANELVEKGIPRDVILIDGDSHNTLEDIQGAKRLIKEDLRSEMPENTDDEQANRRTQNSDEWYGKKGMLGLSAVLQKIKACFNRFGNKEILNSSKGPKIALVSSNYHVLRSLIISRKEKMRDIGYGASVRTDYRMNAFVNEYYRYLRVSRSVQIKVMIIIALIWILLLAFVLIYTDIPLLYRRP
jgi:uncharacterized SAM-binding protein YcdF (DUF218 family)